MSAETKQMSALDIFKKSQETLDDARKKSLEESGNKTKYFRLSQDGTYNVRILPLAPVIDKDGNPIFPMDRVGYEYPVKEQVLKIKSTDGKKTNYVSVCNAKYAFPKLEKDLIDLYVELCCDLYADDEALCKKVRETSFNGGLRYDSKRCMYIFDLDKRGDGLQILQLSFSQYRELEERKLKLWEKLNKNGNVPCPISSVDAAFPLEITRATEKKKTNYSFNIDTVSPKDVLTEEETQMLLDAPRLPEVLYRYTRYHLEATIAFLEQWDETAGLNVMKEKEIQDCIDQIKLLIPASDQSHFNANGRTSEGGENGGAMTLDDLWDMYEEIDKAGLDDKSEEGQNLRTAIKEFIEDNELETRITRGKSNADLLGDIQDELDALEKENKKAPKEDEPEDEPEDDAPAAEPKDNEPEDEPEEQTSRRRPARNEDTNEPAARAERRVARPIRRR